MSYLCSPSFGSPLLLHCLSVNSCSFVYFSISLRVCIYSCLCAHIDCRSIWTPVAFYHRLTYLISVSASLHVSMLVSIFLCFSVHFDSRLINYRRRSNTLFRNHFLFGAVFDKLIQRKSGTNKDLTKTNLPRSCTDDAEAKCSLSSKREE